MGKQSYTKLLVPTKIELIDNDAVVDYLAQLVDDINDRFEALYAGATGQSESISQTALHFDSGELATTPMLGAGVVFQLSAPTAATIPGFAGGYGGRVVVIQNRSHLSYTIPNECTTALEAHRVTTRTGADLTITTGSGLVLVYDDVTSRWIPVCTQL